MTRTAQRADALDVRRLSSRCAFALCLAGSVATFVSAASLSGPTLGASVAVAGLAVVVAVLCLVLPFHRWPRAAMLPIIPVGCLMVAISNYCSPNPYDSSAFLMFVAAFTGLSQPRGMTLLVSPLLALTYLIPTLATQPGSQDQLITDGTCYVLFVSVVLGELTAYLVARLTRAARTLHEHDERRFAGLVENASDITVLVSFGGVVEYASGSLSRILGIEPADVVGGDCSTMLERILHPEDVAYVAERLRADLTDSGSPRAGAASTILCRMTGANGEWRFLECARSVTADGVVINARDVTERRRLELEVREQTLRHPVTGLANRTLLADRLGEVRGGGRDFAVVYCDIDGFKAVNDQLGRAGGDAVLCLVAQRIGRLVPSGSLLAHLEGDEFAVLLVDVGLTEAEDFASRLLFAFSAPVERADLGRTAVSVSLGVSGSWLCGAGVPGLGALVAGALPDPLTEADIAMHVAKAEGGSVSRVYSPVMREELMSEHALRDSIRSAQAREEFRLHFQPIVDVTTVELTGLEALIRWQHPTRGLLGPWAFLDMAETMGLMGAVDRWVLRNACHTIARLKRELPEMRDTYLSANVSPARLEEPGFAGEVMAVLAESGLPAGNLVLEITESAALGLESVITAVRALRGIGVRFAVDDFGTGYSSLSYLQALDFDILKVDKSFTDHLTAEESSTRLVSVIAELGRTLGLHTVVEGVELEVQALALQALGVPSAQGYLYSRPVSPEDLPTAIAGLREHAMRSTVK